MSELLTEPDLAQERQQAHAYLDRLPKDQLTAIHTLLESMLSPLDRSLALAPMDDEALTVEELAAIQAGVESLERNGGIPLEEVLADFGFTMADWEKMADEPFPEETPDHSG